ncbi:MAG: phage tail tube protein [Nitrospirae bacterium]|nr:phage tail tube protein [Nitrospirota bacterium]
MPQATGANSKIIYDVETTFKTTPGTPASLVLPFISENLSGKRGLFRSNVLRGNRNQTQPKRLNKDAGGSINTELNPYMGKLLKHLMGTNVTTGVNPYTHTMKIGALPVSLCLEKQFLDLTTPQYFLYNGCRINKASFDFGTEGVIPLSLDFIGAKETIAGTSFHASPTDLGHLPFDMYEATVVKEGGSVIAQLSSVKFTVENNLDAGVYVIGGAGERRALPEGTTLVSGEIVVLYEDMVVLTKAINFTESAIQITLSRGDGLGSAGNESLDIQIPELMYGQASPLVSGPKGVLYTLPFSGFYDNNAMATSMQLILKNTQVTL